MRHTLHEPADARDRARHREYTVSSVAIDHEFKAVAPAIRSVWMTNQEKALKRIREHIARTGKGAVFAADAQYFTMGHSSSYCCVTFVWLEEGMVTILYNCTAASFSQSSWCIRWFYIDQ